jgi:hypothetical protein
MEGGREKNTVSKGRELRSEVVTWESVYSCVSEHGKHSTHELRAGAPRCSDSTEDLLYEKQQVGLKKERGREK